MRRANWVGLTFMVLGVGWQLPAQADMIYPGGSGGLTPQDFTLLGTKWEPGPNAASFGPMGTPGSATWSVMAAGLADASGFDAHGGGLTTLFTALIAGDELAMIDACLDLWDAASGFTNLGMVADGGVGMGAAEGAGGHIGDIRVGAIDIDGAYGVLAHNFQPGTEAIFGAGGTIAGDSHYDDDEFWIDDPFEDGTTGFIDLFTVMLHELGHALGLGHSAVVGSVMFPFYGGANRTLSADDIAGIVAIYGPADVEPPAVPEPGSMVLLVSGALALGWRARRQRVSQAA